MVPICLLVCRYNGGSDRFGGSAAAAPMPGGPERYITGHKATPHKLHSLISLPEACRVWHVPLT